MIWNRDFYAFMPRNPIILRDLSQYKRSTSFLFRYIDSVGIVAFALCYSAVLIFHTATGFDARSRAQHLDSIQFFAWALHAVIALRLLAGGARSIRQEFSLIGSDELMTTPLTNWQVFIGKWWATMHRFRGWMLALGILHLGIVASTALGRIMSFSWGIYCAGDGSPCIFTIVNLYQAPAMQVSLFFIIVPVIVIAVLETMCCTALGMVATMLARSNFGFIAAVFLRFLPVLIFAFVPDYSWASSNYMHRFREYTWFSFADGGTGALIQLTYAVDVNRLNFQRGVRGFGAIVAMFLLYLSASLVTVWAVMRRSRN